MDDKTLRQNILDELEFEPSIDAAHIGLAVDNKECGTRRPDWSGRTAHRERTLASNIIGQSAQQLFGVTDPTVL
jgi:hypothetical protein